MKLFNFDDQYSVICEFKSTRHGFKHEAILLRNGSELEKTKVCYSNRTWESYTYATTIHKLLQKSKFLSDGQKETFKIQIDKAWAYQ